MSDIRTSVFDFGAQAQKFWKICDKSVLDNESYLIEHEFLTHGKQQVKPVFLLLGQAHLFKVTVDKLKRVPLTTIHLTYIDTDAEHIVQLNSEEPLHGFRLAFQGKLLEIFTEDKLIYDNWRLQLKGKCLLSNFHDAFMVQKLIGKGSFAKVYLATKKENNQIYAIKAFSKSYMMQQHKGIESLLNEILVMRRIAHPNAVTLHEVHETANSIYFVIDIISGGELLQRVRETGFMNPETLQRLAFNLLSALSHLHSKHIVHRDLKPENLLLKTYDNSHDIVLADFGLAASLKEELLFKRCGTPGFVAPEILDFNEGMELYDEKCDVFSAGQTGSQPFSGKDQKSILKANKDCLVDFDDALFKAAPIQLQDLVRCMLQKKPQNRLSSEECLRHSYFKELVKECQQKPGYVQKLQEYDAGFRSALRQGQGDVNLEQRSPAYNGNVNTLESISQTSNVSLTKFEQKAASQIGASKFSQYSARLTHQNSRELGDIPQTMISKTESRRQIDLHRKAIQNCHQTSHRKQMTQDQFEDLPIHQECSKVGEMVRMYNSTRQIRVPESMISKMLSTPKAKQ